MEVAVIGSGLAGTFAAHALAGRGASVTILDVGETLDARRQGVVDRLHNVSPQHWRAADFELIDKNPTYGKGVLPKKISLWFRLHLRRRPLVRANRNQGNRARALSDLRQRRLLEHLGRGHFAAGRLRYGGLARFAHGHGAVLSANCAAYPYLRRRRQSSNETFRRMPSRSGHSIQVLKVRRCWPISNVPRRRSLNGGRSSARRDLPCIRLMAIAGFSPATAAVTALPAAYVAPFTRRCRC